MSYNANQGYSTTGSSSGQVTYNQQSSGQDTYGHTGASQGGHVYYSGSGQDAYYGSAPGHYGYIQGGSGSGGSGSRSGSGSGNGTKTKKRSAKSWYCCQCGHGPHNTEVDTACVNPDGTCGHYWCTNCQVVKRGQ